MEVGVHCLITGVIGYDQCPKVDVSARYSAVLDYLYEDFDWHMYVFLSAQLISTEK